METFLFTSREESAKEAMLDSIFFNTDDLKYSENTNHYESILVSMVTCHEF